MTTAIDSAFYILPVMGLSLPFSLIFLCILQSQVSASGPYLPTWDSLDKRPLPSWYDESKIGIFIHWSVWAVNAYGGKPRSEAAFLWMYWKMQKDPEVVKWMKDHYPPGWTYADFAPGFTAEFYDPNQWADVFKASGARWVKFFNSTKLAQTVIIHYVITKIDNKDPFLSQRLKCQSRFHLLLKNLFINIHGNCRSIHVAISLLFVPHLIFIMIQQLNARLCMRCLLTFGIP